jgi:hypothetical protein
MFLHLHPHTLELLVLFWISENLAAGSTLPQFVLDYAPLVWLHPEETFMPSDIASQLKYTHPQINFANITGAPDPPTLDNLDQLNDIGGSSIYLSSLEDFSVYPPWLHGVRPDNSGETQNATSCAIIVNDKGNGIVDAFYMYFYAFNLGDSILNEFAGSHVGDWEHNMIRFLDGKPQAVWYSQHTSGEAFAYNVLEKAGQRPITYSANGTHANYAIPGPKDHTIPGFNLPVAILLKDYCDRGTLWDPTKSAYIYTRDGTVAHGFRAYNGQDPIAWLAYSGQWGDQELPQNDARQRDGLGLGFSRTWTQGPTGPAFKDLTRTNVCPGTGRCQIRPILMA